MGGDERWEKMKGEVAKENKPPLREEQEGKRREICF